MAEITVQVTKDRIAAEILIAAIASGHFRTAEGDITFRADQLVTAFKTLREALE